jgi:hypothetical protein
MKAASISEIKQELQNTPSKEVIELCLKLARFKKENKELLSYLLFESHDLESYTAEVKTMMDELFKEVNTSNLYFAKKNLRRILRNINKHIRYTGSKQMEAVTLIHFCTLLRSSGISLKKSIPLQKLFAQQIKKIKAAIADLHEDIQYDLIKEMEKLE